MNDISKTGFNPLDALGLAAPAKKEEGGNAIGQAEFFDLMVAQLTNQDPLKPLENAEFVNQVAQFATVDGIQKIEQSIENLTSSMASSQALEASTLVGRNVLLPRAGAELTQGSGIKGAVDAGSIETPVTISVINSANQTVAEFDVKADANALTRFEWDGRKSNGDVASADNYRFLATALVDGMQVAQPILLESKVGSVTVSKSPSSVTLNLDSLGDAKLDEVREFL